MKKSSKNNPYSRGENNLASASMSKLRSKPNEIRKQSPNRANAVRSGMPVVVGESLNLIIVNKDHK